MWFTKNVSVRVALVVAAIAGIAAESTKSRTARDGIYTTEQATRGKKAYDSQCARCHGETLGGGEDSPPLVDQEFLKGWIGKTIGQLVEYTREEMPSDGPGKLSRKQCTDIVAFLLGANGFPAGQNELEPDVDVLNLIQITPKK